MADTKLPSGAVLKVQASPFAVSKALYQAILKEFKLVSITSKNDIGEIVKNAFCAGFASPEIEQCIWKCFERCTYDSGKGDLKIDDQTFEPVERREDYMKVCAAVVKENISPFVKSLSVDFKTAMAMIVDIQS